MKLKSLTVYLLVFMSLAGLALSAGRMEDRLASDEEAVRGLRQELASAQEEYTALGDNWKRLKKKVEQELVEIKKLKQELAKEKGFLKERRLESLLKHSRDGIRTLEGLRGQADGLRREMLKYAAALMLMYNRLIDETLRLVDSGSADDAMKRRALPRMAGWIIERQRARQTYFELRLEEDSRTGKRQPAVDVDAVGKDIRLAREILRRQVKDIDRELMLLEEKSDDLRTERSHWLRMKRFMHRMSRRRGDPLLDDEMRLDDHREASELLRQGRGIERIEAEIKKLGKRISKMKKERARAHKLLKHMGDK